MSDDEHLHEPLVGAVSGAIPGQAVLPIIRLVGEGDDGIETTAVQVYGDAAISNEHQQHHSEDEADEEEDNRGVGLPGSIVVLAKAIVGAGSAALPYAFARLGVLASVSFLLIVAFMTQFSVEALAMATLATGQTSYPATVDAVLGRPAAVLLELSLVLRCAGLMIVYIVIAADILAGGHTLPGLLCEVLGPVGEGWCSSRKIISLVLTVVVLVPLVTPRKLSSSRATSFIGLTAAGIWAGVTVILAVAAWLSGISYEVRWLPDSKALGGGSLAEQALAMLATLPVIATAYTCQMTVHFVMKELKGFTQTRMAVVSAVAISVCTIFFLSVGVGSCTAFGRHVPADILEMFSQEALSEIIPWPLLAWGLGIAVRFGFLLSILANFPMQMLPYRESLSRLAFGHELYGSTFYTVTYASLGGFYLIAMKATSIWTPLQLVGATAGALIAFFFPAAVVLRTLNMRAWVRVSKPAYWTSNSWGLIIVGVVQVVTGVGAVLLDAHKKD